MGGIQLQPELIAYPWFFIKNIQHVALYREVAEAWKQTKERACDCSNQKFLYKGKSIERASIAIESGRLS